MALTKDEFSKAWIAAKESQESYVIETAWKRYQQTQLPSYKTEPESSLPTTKQFQTSLQPFIESADIAASIQTSKFQTVPSNKLPWRPTGIHLKSGQQISLFSTGRLWRSRVLDEYFTPQVGLSYRIGVNGEYRNSTRDTVTINASDFGTGELYLASAFPGSFQDRTGRVTQGLETYASMDGKFEVLIVLWKEGVNVEDLLERALRTASAGSDKLDLIKTERDRPSQERAAKLPVDWHYFWFIGWSDLYRRSDDINGSTCIRCKPQSNVGIIQKELRPVLEFKRGCTVQWDWKIDALPSRVREDTTFSHDYLSVAFEFENGRDITYTWSWELPVNYGYWCPLATWEAREYHVVIRNGTGRLNQWLTEKRDLYEDYKHYIGEDDIPQQIVRVWLIANNMFQRLDGDMTVKEISIEGGGEGVVKVL